MAEFICQVEDAFGIEGLVIGTNGAFTAIYQNSISVNGLQRVVHIPIEWAKVLEDITGHTDITITGFNPLTVSWYFEGMSNSSATIRHSNSLNEMPVSYGFREVFIGYNHLVNGVNSGNSFRMTFSNPISHFIELFDYLESAGASPSLFESARVGLLTTSSIRCTDSSNTTSISVMNSESPIEVTIIDGDPPVDHTHDDLATIQYVDDRISFAIDEVVRLATENDELRQQNEAFSNENRSLRNAVRALNAAWQQCLSEDDNL